MPAAPPNQLANSEPWDAVSEVYTCELLPMFEVFSWEALTRAELPAGARIADIATGPGTLALLAAQAGVHVTALDFSAEMLVQLRQRARGIPLTGSLAMHQCDGQKLPFAVASFDGAFSMFGLIFFPDRRAGFQELRRVLKPGCKALVSSWVPAHGPFGTVMELVRSHVPGDRPATPEPTLGSPEDYDREMKAAGFSAVRVDAMAHERHFASVEEFWFCVQRTNPGALQMRRKLGDETWARMGPAILQELRDEWGSGKVVLHVRALLGIGTR